MLPINLKKKKKKKKKKKTFITQPAYRLLMAPCCLEDIAQTFVTHIQDCQNLARCSFPIHLLPFHLFQMSSPPPQTNFSFFSIQQVLIRKIINYSMKSFQATQAKCIFCASIFHCISTYCINAIVITLCYRRLYVFVFQVDYLCLRVGTLLYLYLYSGHLIQCI